MLIVVAVFGVAVGGAALWLRQALPRIAAAEIGHLMNARVETGLCPRRPGQQEREPKPGREVSQQGEARGFQIAHEPAGS